MKMQAIKGGFLVAALFAVATDVLALAGFFEANTVQREVDTDRSVNFQGQAVSAKLDFNRLTTGPVTRVFQLYGAAEQMQDSSSDDAFQFSRVALSYETKRWSERRQRYVFLSYGLAGARYDAPRAPDTDLIGFRVGVGSGFPVYRNRLIVTADVNIELLQELTSNQRDGADTELMAITGKWGLLWSFENFRITASYSYRYINFENNRNNDVVDIAQMIGVGIGFALN